MATYPGEKTFQLSCVLTHPHISQRSREYGYIGDVSNLLAMARKVASPSDDSLRAVISLTGAENGIVRGTAGCQPGFNTGDMQIATWIGTRVQPFDGKEHARMTI